VRLTTYLHLVPGLRISGIAPLLPLYTFMACLEISLPLPLVMVLYSQFAYEIPLKNNVFELKKKLALLFQFQAIANFLCWR
jgi:hypothetical protein